MGFPSHVPGEGVACVDIPETWSMIQLLGYGSRHGSVAFSKDQVDHLSRIYGFDDSRDLEISQGIQDQQQADWEERTRDWEEALKLPRHTPEYRKIWEKYSQKWMGRTLPYRGDPPEKPRETSIISFLRAGSSRNLSRWAERDGLRVMAFLSRLLETGEDPVRFVGRLCMEAGYEVPGDPEWYLEENDA